MQWHSERLVELLFDDRGQGTGFLITSRHVLTARHISTELAYPGRKCSARLLRSHEGKPSRLKLAASVAWSDDELDIAVVQLDSDIALQGKDVCFGDLDDTRPLDFFFTGFPEGAGEDTRTVQGKICYEPNSGRYDLDYQTSSLPAAELWAGVSGSMVFHGEHAVGIVRTVSRKWNKSFTATPLHQLFANEGFKTYWRKQHQPPVRMTRLGSSPVPPASVVECSDPSLLAWCDRTNEFQAISRLATAGQPRLFGLAGNTHHCALYVVRRLALELGTSLPNVWHIHLENHPDFKSTEELGRTIQYNAAFELGSDSLPHIAQQLAAYASQARCKVLLISAPFDCDRGGPKGLRERLAIVADWLQALGRFPCPVVFTLLLRWSVSPASGKAGWISRLFRAREGQPDVVRMGEVQSVWRDFARARGQDAAEAEESLCALEGYLPGHVHDWLDLRRVQDSLKDRVLAIRSSIDTWFDDKPSLTFTELQIELSKIKSSQRSAHEFHP